MNVDFRRHIFYQQKSLVYSEAPVIYWQKCLFLPTRPFIASSSYRIRLACQFMYQIAIQMMHAIMQLPSFILLGFGLRSSQAASLESLLALSAGILLLFKLAFCISRLFVGQILQNSICSSYCLCSIAQLLSYSARRALNAATAGVARLRSRLQQGSGSDDSIRPRVRQYVLEISSAKPSRPKDSPAHYPTDVSSLLWFC